MNEEYTPDTIETMVFGRALREKLGMYLSADKQEALNLCLRELIYNSQDEFEQGFCSKVEIHIDTKNRTITVEDDARGIPVGKRQDGTNSLTAAMLYSHSGAKHKEGVYSGAVGINGLGLKIVCHTSEWLDIEVKRDNKLYKQSFYETDNGAVPKTEVLEIGTTSSTGTKIIYKPSKKVYLDYWLDYDIVKETIKELSFFTKGLKFILFLDEERFEYFSKDGLIDALNKEGRIGQSTIHYITIIDDVKVELALQWNTKYKKLHSYANNLEVRDGGVFMTGFKTSLTKTFNGLAKDNFSGDIIRKYLNGYVSVKVKIAQFTNQSKTSLANTEARGPTSKAISEALNDFMLRHPQDFEKIIELLKKEERAEKAADKARDAIINSTKEIESAQKKKTYNVEKLKDCINHGPESTLLICEGKSASGALQTARPIEDVALYAIRGKIINAKTNAIEKVLENEEVKDLIKIIGAGFFEKFNEKKMNFGKIGMAVDSDADGQNIACLLMVLFNTLMPGLIEAGHLYWLKTPFYEVVQSGKTYYFETDAELKEWGKTNGNKKYTIKRNKGLGSLSDKAKKEGIFDNPDSLVRLTMSDVAMAKQQLENLMGENVEFRKEFIFKNIDFSQIIE